MQYDSSRLPPPPAGQAYVLILEDPDDAETWFEVWTTNAPQKYIHSKMYYAYRKPDDPLSVWLLDLRQRGKYPRVEYMDTKPEWEARAHVRSHARKRRKDGGV